MKRLTISILSMLVFSNLMAINREESKKYYYDAFDEIHAMLENEIPMSFKRAVFLTENAYLDGLVRYKDFEDHIEFLTSLSRSLVAERNLKYSGKDYEQVLKSSAVYQTLKDTLNFLIPYQQTDSGTWIYEKKPFTYDMHDFWGDDDWTKMFVMKLLVTNSGNCHSLPILYKILADELGVDAYLSIAPNHTYIKQWSNKDGWYNTELTTGRFPYDKDIKWNSYIKTEAVANGVYMDTLSTKQSIAYVITDLVQGYVKKFNYDDLNTPLNWLETALEYYPNYVNALILKAELQKRKFEQQMSSIGASHFSEALKDEEMTLLFSELENAYFKIHKLGYRRMPKEMYLNWLFKVNDDTTRKPHRFEIPQPFKEYDYDVYVATAGDGQNYEFYDQDTLARIGTVEINRLTGKIVRFVEYDYSEEMPDEIISRMYDPALGRFWQIDPHAIKYADWNPYNYAFANPIFFNDPDGKDGRAHYRSGDGTKDNPHVITITANYYYNTNNLTKEEAAALNKSISNYNGLVTSSGKAKDGTYTEIRFKLTTTGLDSDDAVRDAAGADTFEGADGDTYGYGNIVQGHNSSGDEFGDADGLTIRVNRTNINDAVSQGFSQGDILESTLNHEIGHNLSGKHGDPSPMGEALRLYYRQNPGQIGGQGTPTVPNASVTKKFVTTIEQRIGTVNPGGQIMYEKGHGRQ